MGCQYRSPALIVLFSLFLFSCGEFVGFDHPEPDLGDLREFRTYLGEEDVSTLNDSITISEYADCRFEGPDGYAGLEGRGDARIRIRGYTSRLVPKKNFTLFPDGGEIKYALDAGNPWTSYNIAMYAYSLLGLPATQLYPVGHYMNGEYLGYYNIIRLYDDSLDDYYGEEGELFKIRFHDPGNAVPAEEDCEKKYPDNDDYSSLNLLLVYSEHLETAEWVPWIEENVDLRSVAAYMVVRDFLGVADTSFTNFYIYVGEKYRILPWDNDRMFDYGGVGGNNVLTRRMLESEIFQEYYRDLFNRYFLQPGPDNMIEDLLAYKENLENLLEPAAQVEPVFYRDYETFREEKAYIETFLTTRGADILADSHWQGFFSQ